MSIETLSGVIIACTLALLGGMAGIIKGLVLRRVDEGLEMIRELRKDHSDLRMAVACLKAEHDIRVCHREIVR